MGAKILIKFSVFLKHKNKTLCSIKSIKHFLLYLALKTTLISAFQQNKNSKKKLTRLKLKNDIRFNFNFSACFFLVKVFQRKGNEN